MASPTSLANLRAPWTADTAPRAGQRVPPVTAALRKLFELADEGGKTNAEKFAELAMQRASENRKDAAVWAKLILERVDGPVKRELELSLGMPELLKGAHERWLRQRTSDKS